MVLESVTSAPQWIRQPKPRGCTTERYEPQPAYALSVRKRNEDGDGEGLRRRGGWTVGKEHRSRLVHTGLGSLTPIAHVLPYPPPLTRTALYQVLQYNNKHTHRGMKGVCVRKFVQVAKLHLLRLVCSSNPEDTNYEIETQSGFGPVSHCVL